MNLLSALLSEGSLIDLDVTVFIQLGLFFIAFFILKTLVFGPIIRLFEKREEMIEGARLQAKELHGQAENAETELAEAKRRARLQASAEREKMRAEGKRLEAEIMERARESSSRQLAEAEKSLEQEAATIRTEMKARVPALAKTIASKLLAREVA